MTVEELKKEARKLGYTIIKKNPYITLDPCKCGRKKPWMWPAQDGSEFYKCPDCGLRAPNAKNNRQARINWNELVSEVNGNETLD